MTPEEIANWRRETRTRLIEKRRAVSPIARTAWSGEIERRLYDLLKKTPAEIIAGYAPIRGEFDPVPLLDRLTRGGRRAALPAIIMKGEVMEFRAWDADSEMEHGLFGIPVPKKRDIVIPQTLFIPCVGFDAENYRLGYGGGYFDRTLAALSPRPMAIGLAFELGRLETVYPQPHDIRLDVIVTETGVQKLRPPAPPAKADAEREPEPEPERESGGPGEG
jgi:5-formyltetrahydrofolate cyclo-ligase